MSKDVKALIAVKSTERRDALVALLSSLNQIDVIVQAGNQQATRDCLEVHDVSLVLADFDLFDAIRDDSEEMVIVLVGDRSEQALAYAKGAKWVFIEGTPVSQLVTTIEQRLLDVENAR